MAELKSINMGVFGDKGTGKTSLVERFIENKFGKATPSMFMNMPTTEKDVYGTQVKFSIYDMPGAIEYRSLSLSVYAGIEAVLLCFDVTDEESYNALTAWINDIQGGVPEGTVKILVGMKIDGERKVPTETARNFASQKDYIYMEASAKSGGKPVEEVFKMAAAKVLGIPLPQPPPPKTGPTCCCFM